MHRVHGKIMTGCMWKRTYLVHPVSNRIYHIHSGAHVPLIFVLWVGFGKFHLFQPSGCISLLAGSITVLFWVPASLVSPCHSAQRLSGLEYETVCPGSPGSIGSDYLTIGRCCTAAEPTLWLLSYLLLLCSQ